MKKFISVEIEIHCFAVEDIVRTSNGWLSEGKPGDEDFSIG